MRPHHLSLLGLLAGVGPLAAQVRPGIEVLLADSIHLVAGKRVALLTNQTGVDRQGRRDVDLLRASASVELRLLFSPEHGFRGADDRPGVPDGVDSASGLPIYSLYGGARPPNFAPLAAASGSWCSTAPTRWAASRCRGTSEPRRGRSTCRTSTSCPSRCATA